MDFVPIFVKHEMLGVNIKVVGGAILEDIIIHVDPNLKKKCRSKSLQRVLPNKIVALFVESECCILELV